MTERCTECGARRAAALEGQYCSGSLQLPDTHHWKEGPMRKYRNQPTIVDGIRFDRKKEANRWAELKLL